MKIEHLLLSLLALAAPCAGAVPIAACAAPEARSASDDARATTEAVAAPVRAEPVVATVAPPMHEEPAPAAAASPRREDPAPESVDALIARGRAELAAGRAAEAQALFDRAAEQDPSLDTRRWVIRSWMAQGRINDSLDAIDALDRAGVKGPSIDYLYGMAFVAKARDYASKGVSGQIIGMSYVDAVAFLEKATQADPRTFADAFLPLAEAAYEMQKLDVARPAAERAVALDPRDAGAAFLLGRIALAQYGAEQADPAREAEANASWELARASFAKAIELASASTPADGALAGRASNQLGHVFAWKQKLDEAAEAYARAAGFDPTSVDFTQVLGALGPDRFAASIESAAKSASAAGRPLDPTLAWWLGYARFQQKQYETAEQAFSTALAARPDFYNSSWYVALSRYHRQDYVGAAEALRANWEANPEDLLASIAQNRELHGRILVYLVGACANAGKNREAAVLCEILSAAEPDKPDHLNNAGLFWRDAGEPLKASEKPEDRALAAQYFEKSYEFYVRALAKEPENPGFLNDTAVMLHYYLDRDLDRAREMYARARDRASEALAKPDLPEDRRDWFKIALRDSKNNLKLLDEQQREREARKKEPAGGASGGEPRRGG